MNYNLFFNHLSELISYKSIEGRKSTDAPFGCEVKGVLQKFLNIASSFGFSTINYDNYGGEVYFGKGEEIGIIGHLDVVPTGIGWKSDPFSLVEEDGKVIGRGVLDDKGPSLLCLYALKALVDEGVVFKRKIRFFIGCNEETGWQDVDYIKSKTNFPKYGFSPDGDFPVSYAEKGIFYVKIKLPKFKRFYELSGGTVINAVCDYASIKATETAIDENLLKSLGLSLKNGNTIESFGVGAHGSSPSQGKNALKPIFKYLQIMGENVFNLGENLFEDKIGLSAFKNEQGVLTISPDLIVNTEDGQELWCDLRVPAPMNIEEIKPTLDKLNLPYTVTEKHPPFMVDKKGFLVDSLLKAYNEVNGTDLQPIALGGSTFARAFEQGCSFGLSDKNGTGGCHMSNEFVTKEHFIKSFEVYKKAIYNLVK